ncbi:MAG TPA: ATP-binding protein [Thermoanaerobaculia bacterium]|nr:ATP-binding protein [Thermoanaerobaculia bacterium]
MPRRKASPPTDPLSNETLLRAPIGICHVEPDGALSFANAALALLLGYGSIEQLIAERDSRTLFHEVSPAHSVEALAAGRISFQNAEAFLRMRDGGSRLVHIDGTMLGDSSAARWALYVTDAGREKEREVELARALAELENTMQTIPDILYTLDVEARLVRWNRKLETATGFSAAELQHRQGFELFREEEKPVFAKAIMTAFASGYAEFETFLLARDGNTIPYQWTAVPLEDAQGKVVGLAGAGRDVTEWRRNEEARARLEETIRNRAREWQLTFDAITSPILLANSAGKIVRLNRSAKDLFGDVAFSDVAGHMLQEFADHEPWATMLRLVTGKEEETTAEAYDAFTGRTWSLAISQALLSTAPNAPASDLSIIFARDITRLLELQETARRNEVMSTVGQLIVGVAHEVRNPIFGISATLDAFEASFAVDDDARQFLEVLRGEIGRLSDLMQELLDYGKPASLEFHEGSLSEVVEQAVRVCAKTGERNRIEIVNRVPRDLPPVPMDRRKLLQVFQNLIDNAIQFSKPEGGVEVHAATIERSGADWVAVSVADSGPGFPEGDLPRIFEPFFTKRRGGTGLGLSIVQRIVDEHGGRIEATNRAEGGALMTVFLPRER